MMVHPEYGQLRSVLACISSTSLSIRMKLRARIAVEPTHSALCLSGLVKPGGSLSMGMGTTKRTNIVDEALSNNCGEPTAGT
jgi:hypothetical protein